MALENVVADSLVQIPSAILNAAATSIPLVIGAIITLVIGFVLGRVAGWVVYNIVGRIKLDKWLAEEEKLNIKLSVIGDVIARWLVYLFFITLAAAVLGNAGITAFVTKVIEFVYSAIGAGLFIIAGYIVATYIKDRIVSSRTVYADMVGKVIFFLTLYISIALALPLLGVNAELVNNILLVIIGSIGLGLAIAIGLGLKDSFGELAKDYTRKFRGKR